MKEELLTEQHSNELKMKHMMSDMEEMATKQTFQEIAYKSIIKAFPNEKTPQEIRGGLLLALVDTPLAGFTLSLL